MTKTLEEKSFFYFARERGCCCGKGPPAGLQCRFGRERNQQQQSPLGREREEF